MTDLLIKSLIETLIMVGISSVASICFGIPLGIYLTLTARGGLSQNSLLYTIAGALVNTVRSVPYIILMVIMMPITRLLVGTTIGVFAATIPLAIAGILLLARMSEDTFNQMNKGLIEFGVASGATTGQIIRTILLPESLPILISNITTVIISLIGFSAMAGAVGGGGLGDLAIRYGYQRYELELLIYIVIILVLIVHMVQYLGNYLVNKLKK